MESSAAFKVLLIIDGKPNYRIVLDNGDATRGSITIGDLKAEINNSYPDLVEAGVCDEMQFTYEVCLPFATNN